MIFPAPYYGINYAIQVGTDGPIKIGYSGARAEGRLSELQRLSPWKMHIIAQWPGDMLTEKALHIELGAFRIRSEWFYPTPTVLAAIEARVKASREKAA